MFPVNTKCLNKYQSKQTFIWSAFCQWDGSQWCEPRRDEHASVEEDWRVNSLCDWIKKWATRT